MKVFSARWNSVRFFNSLRIKLIFTIVILLVIQAIAIGVISYKVSKEELDKSGQIQLQNGVRQVISLIDVMNNEVKNGRISLDEAKERVRVEMLGPKGPDGKRPVNTRYNLGKYGYFFAYDDAGVMVAHPDPKVEGQSQREKRDKQGKDFVSEILDKAKNGGGFVYYTWYYLTDESKFVPKVVYVEMDPHWHWIITAGSYMTDYNQGADRLITVMEITLAISILLGVIVSFWYASRITKPIMRMSKEVQKVIEGDLTIEDIKVKRLDEVGKLAVGFNSMIGHLKEVIGQVKLSSEQVAASSEELMASTEQTSKAAEQISIAVQEVAAGTDRQVQSSSEANQIVEEISKGMDHVASSIQSVTEAAVSANNETTKGNEVVYRAVEQMNVVHEKVETIAQVVNVLEDKSQEIGQIVSLITEISNQTNLLALNAAIEAARAGENGRGFAVVADEVRKLAEQSGSAAQKIRILIQEIQSEAQNAVQAMNLGTQAVGEGIEQVRETGESFKIITKVIEGVSFQAQEVSAIVEEVNTSSRNMVGIAKTVAEISEKSSSNTQNIAAASQEQLATMEEIATSATSLANMAEELQELVRKFKV